MIINAKLFLNTFEFDPQIGHFSIYYKYSIIPTSFSNRTHSWTLIHVIESESIQKAPERNSSNCNSLLQNQHTCNIKSQPLRKETRQLRLMELQCFKQII